MVKISVIVGLLVFFEMSAVLSFNLASKFAKIMSDGNNNSYFGYTVKLHSSVYSDSYSIIVGAPKSKSVYHPTLVSPGAVYECTLNSQADKCSQINLERSGEARYSNTTGYSYADLKKNAWIGGALTVSEGTGYITVCGAGWKNQYHRDFYLMNGVCYFFPNIKSNYPESQKLLPLLYQGNQGYKFTTTSSDPNAKDVQEVFFYSYGEAGVSVDALENEIIIGAPGVFDWKGTVIRYRIVESYDHRKSLGNGFVPNPYFTREIPIHGYLGYSVGHGRFFGNPEKSYAAGAPRAGAYRGKVFIFKMGITTEDPLRIEIELEGRQMGEYFGASLCVVDLNQDGFDDILIGAPQHSKNDGEISSDEGKVYVFVNDKNGNLQKLEMDLVGSKVSGARFGTAVSAIGDLDHDGYPEIVIGAPYENDFASKKGNTGAIYIYKGTNTGISAKYSQKIHSSEFGYGIKGFGIDVSKGLDVDGNHYNDIAVGAYESGHVVLIQASPVVQLLHSVTADIAYIQRNTTRFQLSICFKYEGYHVPQTLEVDVSVTLDKILKRAYFEARGNTILYRSILTEKSDNCEVKTVLFEPSRVSVLKNRYAALPIALNYSLASPKSQEFCKTCPVMDPSSDTFHLTRIGVMSKCDKISTCIPDWKISAQFHGIEIPFVIGSKDTIDLKARIANRGDTSTLEHFIVILPENVPLKITPGKCNKIASDSWKCLSDVIVSSEQEETLDLTLDVSKLEVGSGTAIFYFVLSSFDDESEKVNRNFTLSLPLKEESRIEISAKAKPSVYVETTEDKKSVLLTHSYHVYNSGFTRIKNFRFRCLVPEMIPWKSSTQTVIEKHQLTAALNSEPIQCDAIAASKFNESQSVSVANDVHFIDCTSGETMCKAYECQIPELDSNSNGIHVEIKVSVLLEAIKFMFEKSFHVYYNTSFIVLNEEGLQKSAATRFDRALIPEKINPQFWWYIIMAIVFAVIVLSVIIFILYKRKFFQRSRYPREGEQGNLMNEMAVPEPEEFAT